MKEKSICFYHDDMDGILSAAIVRRVYPNCELIRMQYGYDEPKLIEKYCNEEYDSVFIVDFCFTDLLMNMFKTMATKEFIWCDHHKSAMEKMLDFWDSDKISGLRSLNKSGCGLTWEWFNPHENVPEVVKLVQDYDLWKFEYGDRTRAFGEMNFKLTEPDSPVLKTMLILDNFAKITLNEYVQKGYMLLEAKQARIEKSFKAGKDITLYGHKTRACNSNHDLSNLGNYCCKQGYDIGLVWSMRGNKIILGFRSIGDIDVSLIAKEFGGGGHKNASGAETDLKTLGWMLE